MAGWRSELAGCRSTLSMSKIKVRISETKYRSFYKTLPSVVNNWYRFPNSKIFEDLRCNSVPHKLDKKNKNRILFYILNSIMSLWIEETSLLIVRAWFWFDRVFVCVDIWGTITQTKLDFCILNIELLLHNIHRSFNYTIN